MLINAVMKKKTTLKFYFIFIVALVIFERDLFKPKKQKTKENVNEEISSETLGKKAFIDSPAVQGMKQKERLELPHWFDFNTPPTTLAQRQERLVAHNKRPCFPCDGKYYCAHYQVCSLFL